MAGGTQQDRTFTPTALSAGGRQYCTVELMGSGLLPRPIPRRPQHLPSGPLPPAYAIRTCLRSRTASPPRGWTSPHLPITQHIAKSCWGMGRTRSAGAGPAHEGHSVLGGPPRVRPPQRLAMIHCGESVTVRLERLDHVLPCPRDCHRVVQLGKRTGRFGLSERHLQRVSWC